MIYIRVHLPSVNSRFKRFFINSIFFLVFPCVALCKCFNPSNDDIEQTETTWTRRVIQKELSSDGEQDDELSRLLKMVSCCWFSVALIILYKTKFIDFRPVVLLYYTARGQSQ